MNAIIAREVETPAFAAAWRAQLRLRYAREAGRTVVRERAHAGPLRVLKTLYPEGDEVAHSVLVHPPAGIVGGDTLDIECTLEANAHAVVATPGAQKWYRSQEIARALTPRHAQACTQIRVGQGACLEWLPQEAIVFDACYAQQTITFDLAPTAKLMAWEMLVWGRTAMGERFTSGRFAQKIAITRADGLLWTEQMDVRGGDALLDSPVGYGGMPASANMWIVGAADAPACVAALRNLSAATHAVISGVSCLPGGLIVVKGVAHEIEALRAYLVQCRAIARPSVCGRAGAPLRIWQT